MAPRSRKRLVKKPRKSSTKSVRASRVVAPVDLYRVLQVNENGAHIKFFETRRQAADYKRDTLADPSATVSRVTVGRSKEDLVKILNEYSIQF